MNQDQEQAALRAQLIGQYGEVAFNRAVELSGLRNCMQALATDCLTAKEREEAYVRAGLHLAKLIDAMLDPTQAMAVTACAKRIDAAVEAWTLDDLEERNGLPPLQLNG